MQGEEMFDDDYQVFLPDGRAVGQVLVLGRGHPAAGGLSCSGSFFHVCYRAHLMSASLFVRPGQERME
ncbi:unnamed protein product [Pleuronectes platessa]|uniref:Uncharacterized protein n=1 Tax=Pleuronectes platessa TaxID=8262 RepID=A0A9N7Z2Y6_PLEPL|nr:unnamed protein product [Pleuronectes platessa]